MSLLPAMSITQSMGQTGPGPLHIDSTAMMPDASAMRTTVTIDPDVARRLRIAMRAKNLSFKEALNEAVRRGLDSLVQKSKTKPFRTKSENMGIYAHLN